jgi:hypothetical protein
MADKLTRKEFISLASITGAGLISGVPSVSGKSAHSPNQQVTNSASLSFTDNKIIKSLKAWNKNNLKQSVLKRAAFEKSRRELDVYYYRIGYTIAFQLPVSHRPLNKDLPQVLAGGYPWATWLSWDLENRWRILHEAWRKYDDKNAGILLQRELAALEGWDRFVEDNKQVTLYTAHLAACLSLALSDINGWDPVLLQKVRSTATTLVERDAWPSFEKNWNNNISLTPARVHNIPVIGLVRTTQLAMVSGNPRAEIMEKKMKEVLTTWCRYRTGEEFQTEGTAYDGYLMDSITEWMSGLPYREELTGECRDAFRSLADQWINLTLPGRLFLHPPIGDVEPEMMFWITALMRMTGWYGWGDAAWLLANIPVDQMPAAALSAARSFPEIIKAPLTEPVAAPHEHPGAVSLRTGWSDKDVSVTVSLPRNKMSHLQADGGHLVLGWQGRFWITDPGYRQYRPGEEQKYTLGIEAHNCPVIDGQGQKTSDTRLIVVEADEYGWQHTGIDLTKCYNSLPADALINRDVWLAPGEGAVVVVCDRFRSLLPGVEIRTHWLGETNTAWSFVDGWVRLSYSERAVWLGKLSDRLVLSALNRHPGSRGPLNLTHTTNLPSGSGMHWWVLLCDPEAGWQPPVITPDGDYLKLDNPAHPGINRSFRQNR